MRCSFCYLASLNCQSFWVAQRVVPLPHSEKVPGWIPIGAEWACSLRGFSNSSYMQTNSQRKERFCCEATAPPRRPPSTSHESVALIQRQDILTQRGKAAELLEI